MPSPDEVLTFEEGDQQPEIEVRSESDREIGIRFMTYGEIGRTAQGLEVFEPGAFSGTDPTSVIIRMEHEGPPAGRGLALEERSDHAVLIARAANTPRGDELMSLAKDGFFKGASPSFEASEGGSTFKYVDRQRVTVRKKVGLREVSLTWRPTYAGTEVLYARSQELGDEPMTDAATEAVPEVPQPRGIESSVDEETFTKLQERVRLMEERSSISTGQEPPQPREQEIPKKGEWMKGALTLMDGGDLHPVYQRALADIISADNPAFMPLQYQQEVIGIIDPLRRFMGSTRRIEMPESGLTLSFPRITQRPTVAEQTTQKAEVSSQEVHTDTVTENVRTFAGAGDLSIQLLRRSSPEFLSFYLELLAEAYAQATDNAAVDKLLASSPTAGTGGWDVEEPHFGEAFENAVAVGTTLIPDRIWLSTAALVAMIDAKTPTGGGGTSMYPGLAGISGIDGGSAGPLPMTLQPVWVPALDDEAVDVIVGPSRGFAWAEEGTFTLTADVPGRLGRDIALGGFVVFVAAYPAAFTTYALTS